jgi:hypothetical protein
MKRLVIVTLVLVTASFAYAQTGSSGGAGSGAGSGMGTGSGAGSPGNVGPGVGVPGSGAVAPQFPSQMREPEPRDNGAGDAPVVPGPDVNRGPAAPGFGSPSNRGVPGAPVMPDDMDPAKRGTGPAAPRGNPPQL